MKRFAISIMAATLLTSSLCAETIAQRRENQQDRIGQGIQHGSLTPAEAARLERREVRINREIRRDRRTGGRFTARERARVQRDQNRASRSIYRQKHDAQGQSPR